MEFSPPARMSPPAKHVIVIGAGQLGVAFVMLLHRLQVSGWKMPRITVTLVDRRPDILGGASRASWIAHDTGSEYFRSGYYLAARACMQGGILKRLLVPPDAFEMDPHIDTRFFVSADSSTAPREAKYSVPLKKFKVGVSSARLYYESLHALLEGECGRAAVASLHHPRDFARRLDDSDYHGVSEVARKGGWQVCGGPANMAVEYAYKWAALRIAKASGVLRDLVLRCSIKARSDLVSVADEADLVVCTSGHGNFALGEQVGAPQQVGAHFLNYMLHAELPATQSEELRRKLSQVNFVLQGSRGGMYACILPPTADETGLAALYAPGDPGKKGPSNVFRFMNAGGAKDADSFMGASNEGSVTGGDGFTRTPELWDEVIDEPRALGDRYECERLLTRLVAFNPFLEEYLTDSARMWPVPGPVFNPGRGGGDTRTRGLAKPAVSGPSKSSRVITMSTPKWTTVELAALTLLHAVLVELGGCGLPTLTGVDAWEASELGTYKRAHGCGPYGIDVMSLLPYLRSDVTSVWRVDAVYYARKNRLPVRLADCSRCLLA